MKSCTFYANVGSKDIVGPNVDAGMYLVGIMQGILVFTCWKSLLLIEEHWEIYALVLTFTSFFVNLASYENN